MIKVLVVDDSDFTRGKIIEVLNQDSEIEVIGQAANGIKAYELSKSILPDVILMDLVMPDCDGIEATRLIKQENSKIAVIILTGSDSKKMAQKAIISGADGYLPKDIDSEKLIEAIKCFSDNLKMIDGDVFKDIVEKLKKSEEKFTFGDYELSEKEVNIMQSIAEGKINKEIANNLSMAEGSVKNIITKLLKRFNLEYRTQIAVVASKMGIV